MNTYCYRHGLVYGGCYTCAYLVGVAIRNGYSLLEAAASAFPQLGKIRGERETS